MRSDYPEGDIGFPGVEKARASWDSPAHREIAPPRSRHGESALILIEVVPEGCAPAATAKAVRAASAQGGE